MYYIDAIQRYIPVNEQEKNDKRAILKFIEKYQDDVLYRDNSIAHITSSGFIMNRALDKVLFIHNNIINSWALAGGHADGDKDLLCIAMKKVKEKTGIINVKPLFEEIAAIDIIGVNPNYKNSEYINAHLHLNVAYIFIADETNDLKICKEENIYIKWFPIEDITKEYFSEYDNYLYNKLIFKAINLVRVNTAEYVSNFLYK